jgi:hypothetical protein
LEVVLSRPVYNVPFDFFFKGRVQRIPNNDSKKAWSFLKIKNKSYISPDAIIVAIYL